MSARADNYATALGTCGFWLVAPGSWLLHQSGLRILFRTNSQEPGATSQTMVPDRSTLVQSFLARRRWGRLRMRLLTLDPHARAFRSGIRPDRPGARRTPAPIPALRHRFAPSTSAGC